MIGRNAGFQALIAHDLGLAFGHITGPLAEVIHQTPQDRINADGIIAAYRQIIARAHGRGIRVIGATILAKDPAIKPVEKFQLLTSPSNMAVKKGETGLQQKLNEILAGGGKVF